MAELETRWPCPVCLGTRMEKAVLWPEPLQLDHCRRCGGVWFQAGEVQRLRRQEPEFIWSRISQRDGAARTPCHFCHTLYERTLDTCPACGRVASFHCPECDRSMERVKRDGHAFDVCRKCKGVWFDHHEIAAVWTIAVAASLVTKAAVPATASEAEHGTGLLLEALLYAPDLAAVPIQAAGSVASSAIELAGHAPETIGAAVEVVGEAAGSVFGVILEIIGGIFS